MMVNSRLDQALRAKLNELHPEQLTADQREIRRLRELVNTLQAENTRMRNERSHLMTKKQAYEHFHDLLQKENQKMHDEWLVRSEKYWNDKYEKFVAACPGDKFIGYASLFMQIVQDIMVQEFGWVAPLNQNYADRRYKLCRLMQSLVTRCNEISSDDSVDLDMVGEKLAKKYGLLFGVHEEEE